MKKREKEPAIPTLEELATARKHYVDMEPRHFFYRLAREKVESVLKGREEAYTLAEAVLVLLLTWNFVYYQRHSINGRYYRRFDAVLATHRDLIRRCRQRSIADFDEAKDAPELKRLFGDFNRLLKPVGAAKALHLLAPGFFPLWDNAIAKYRYHIWDLSWPGYLKFMRIRQKQCRGLSGVSDPLKGLDEWDYWHVHHRRKRATRPA